MAHNTPAEDEIPETAEDAAPARFGEDEESPATEESPEPASGGYMLALKLYPDGKIVACKKPLPTEEEGYAEGEEIDVKDIEQGVKALIGMYRQNPIQATEEQAFIAGHGGKQEAGY